MSRFSQTDGLSFGLPLVSAAEAMPLGSCDSWLRKKLECNSL